MPLAGSTAGTSYPPSPSYNAHFYEGSSVRLPADPGPQHSPLGPWNGESSYFTHSYGHTYSQQCLKVKAIVVRQIKTR